jgi:hypothetical protein
MWSHDQTSWKRNGESGHIGVNVEELFLEKNGVMLREEWREKMLSNLTKKMEPN